MWCVLFLFLSYLDRNLVKGHFVDVEVQSRDMVSWCAKVSATVGERSVYQVSDGAEVVSSVLGPSGTLENCTVTVNHMEVKAFMQECRLEVKEQQQQQKTEEEDEEEARFTRMNEAKRMCREFHERSVRSGRVTSQEPGHESVPQGKVLKRSKRGFTYPGTLWCGAGNMADHYDQLGHFAETDSCCRTHDHCPHVIHAFSSKYGYTNFKWHSICHCDCDTELKSCLRKVNDTSSRVVGQAFFNVIGVPCFELTYEEQCAERHWYGLCKRYEKFPVAVVKEAVPYDYGGIDVIDELTLAPPTKKSEEEKEEEKPESTAQSTVSGHEEPSLTNVVTAAEDFIKVLATVSTSQSSSSDSDKGETQSSEKKKKKNKNKGKKKKKTKKPKGKGRKRKQKAEAGSKTEDGAMVSPPGSKAGEVIALSNFISELHKHDQSSRSANADSEYELRGRDEPSNEVMKDEPAMDKDTVPVTSPVIVQKNPAVTDTDALTEETEPSASTNPTMIPHKGKIKGMRRGRRKKVPALSSEELVINTTDNPSSTSAPTVVTITTTTQPEQQSLEKGPVVTFPIGIPKVKRNRSKERGDREGRKKRRKDSSIVATGPEHSSADNLKGIPLHGAPDATSVSTTELQVSHRLEVHASALNSSFSVLKRSKETGLRRRKTNVPPSGESYDNISENVPFIETTPHSFGGPNVNTTTTAAISLPMERLEDSEWKLFTTAAPTVFVKRHRHPFRQQRKSKKKVLAVAAPVNDRVSVLAQTERTPVTLTTTQSKVTAAEDLSPPRFGKTHWTTSASPNMSPIQLSIERVKAQFNRKKRRKAALSFRQ